METNFYYHSIWCDCDICHHQALAINKFREEVFELIDNMRLIKDDDKKFLKHKIKELEKAKDNN